ncbi:MAG TPA: hypothetical protein DIT64_14770 [Verrucomicrobiales bacterium]|nr:hypothetical protein [Verrucomicrobiales bacterium]
MSRPLNAKSAAKDPSTASRDIEDDIGEEQADSATSSIPTSVSAKPKSRSHFAGLLRSERQLLANPSFYDSDTALPGSAFLHSEAKPQVVSEAKGKFHRERACISNGAERYGQQKVASNVSAGALIVRRPVRGQRQSSHRERFQPKASSR